MQQFGSITASIGAKLAAKQQERACKRPDLYAADYIPVSASSANLLIGYEPTLGLPTASHVVAFVANLTKGSVDTAIDTIASYESGPRKAAVSVIVSPRKHVAPITAKEDMIALSSTMFMDQSIGASWEIKQSPDGNEYLQCIRNEDLPELLQTAIASQGVLSNPITFASANVCASVEVNEGDYVEFYTEQGLRRGDVTKVTGDRVSILADDRQWSVEKPAVQRVLRLNPKAEEAKRKQDESFYATFYSPDFAKLLFGRN
jgi:hypothetical protein